MKTITNRRELRSELARYILPSIGAMVFFSLYTMVDGMFVGQGVGPEALAAVNLSMPYINIIFALALIIAVGASTLITFHFGHKAYDTSNNIFSLGFWFLVLLSLGLTLVVWFALDPLIWGLGATHDTVHYVKDYLGIIVLFSPFFMLTYYLEVLVKSDGAPGLSLLGIILSAGVNIVLDYLFVMKFHWGIQGAAVATGIAQVFGFIFFLAYFYTSKATLRLGKIKWNLPQLKKIIKIGIPDSLTELSSGFITFIFNLVIAKRLGSSGLAAFGILMYINNLVTVTMIGINQGIQPLVSYYNGQGKQEIIKFILHDALMISVVCGLAFFSVCQLIPHTLIGLFINPSNTAPFTIAMEALPLFSLGFLVCGLNIVLAGFFTALEKIKPATLISILRGYILVALCVLVLPELFGTRAIWFAPLTYELLTLGVSVYEHQQYQKGLGDFAPTI